jgi:hypothetical protein
MAEARRRQTAQTLGPTNPVEWARKNATIVHPRQGRIAFEPYPYQVEFLEHYHAPRRIVLKARQIGFSQIFALEALYAAITEKESTILLVSRSQDLAVNLLRYCYLTYNNLKVAPKLTKANESEMGFDNGSRIKSIPANRSTGRGFAANRVYLDEFAYAEYAEEIYQSVGPAVAQGGYLVIGSTPAGIGNLYHRLYVAGEGFTRQKVEWHKCPAYYTPDEQAAGTPPEQSEWYLRERPKYTQRAWSSEYDCDFAGSGNGIFRRIDDAKTATHQAGAIPDHQYVIGADWGRTNDATVFKVLDMTMREEVYSDRMTQTDYHLQTTRLLALWEKFGKPPIIAEYNSMGGPLVEQLQRMNVPVQPFVTTNATKALIIDALALAFERAEIKILDDALTIGELQAYESERLPSGLIRYGAPEGMHDDTVIALALAWYSLHGLTVSTAPNDLFD